MQPDDGIEEERSGRLDGLSALQDQFQVEGFVKAAQKVGKGLSRFFTTKKQAPSAAGIAQFGLDDLLHYSNEPIPTSLLKMSGEHVSRAVKMFSGVLKYQGETGEQVDEAQRIEIAQKLLHQGLKRPELKDELYMHLLKQTRGNPNATSRAKAFELFHLVAATMPPSKDFVGLISEYVHAVLHDEAEDKQVRSLASKTWTCLKRSTKAGPRRTLPTGEELEAVWTERKLNTIAFFLDETFEELAFDMSTTVVEAVEQLAGIIKLQNYNTFTLFECRKSLVARTAVSVDPVLDEHLALDDNMYIADILAEFKSSKAGKEGYSSKLLFKKRMFRETDETITEPMFINLAYVQAQYDYLQGHYPVVREDAAQMCALQMQAEHASTLLHDDEAIMQSVEVFVTKQVLMTRPRDEWRLDVSARYKALEHFSKEDARLQFLRILRSLPYGNSIFFNVKRIDDPIGLLPAKLILGVNKRGVHFFRPVPKEYLHSAELRDIMQFGSSSTAVFFKMRVAGVLHIFQFETRQGEDICMALQTHINDIMMKRYSKAKAMAQGGPEARSSGADNAPLGLTQANFGLKYEQHVAQLQKELEDTQQRVEQIQKASDELRYIKDQAEAELEDVVEQLHKEEESRGGLQDEVQSLHREVEAVRAEVALVRANAAVTGAAATGAVSAAGAAADSARLAELEGLLESASKELDETGDKVAALEKRSMQVQKEKELIEKKMQRIEKAKEQEVSELREKLEASQGVVLTQLQLKNDKIKEVRDELANINVLYNDTKAELQESKADQAELEELREMKEDMKRKEKQQAVIIENQGKRLDELDKLYKDEQVTRKRLHNAMEDLKGKVRVNCRVRTLLAHEEAAGEVLALEIPDELTVSHASSDPAKRAEYNFDQVLQPGQGQEALQPETQAMVKTAVEGFNVCTLVYGQAGSGKTHTLFGSPPELGLVPRAATELFRVLEREASKASFTVSCYILGLYQDTLSDLLLPSGAKAAAPKLDIKKDPKGVVTVPGATVVELSNAKQLLQAVEAARARLKTLAPDLSLAHLLLSVTVDSVNTQSGTVARGRLSFVELGSGPGQASVSALHRVVRALASEQQAVPYREHKLTMLLSDALGGNAKTTLWVTVSPGTSALQETEATLQYAAQVRSIKNSASKNDMNKDMLKLKKQMEHWQQQAGLSEQQRAMLELLDITDERLNEE